LHARINMKIKKSFVYKSILLFIFLFTVTGITYQSFKPQYKLELPKSSAGEISIISPENKTNIQSTAGYYPGTFGFENELDGTSRTNIAYVDGTNAIQSNCDVVISNNYQGHKKVLRVHDGNTNGNAEARNYFDSTQIMGTIEWWWSTEVSGTNNIAYHFHEGIMGTHAGAVSMSDNTFKDMEGNVVQSYVSNQWYHNKIIFDTTSDTYEWYIDGILRVDGGNFLNPVNNIGSTNIKGGWTSTGTAYIDAIGYSWYKDTDIILYHVGDNMHEGLLLSYESSIALYWQGYSLDGCVNKTISGNTTIPMPSIGPHSIQVSGAGPPIGTLYQSEIRYFFISQINLITPENKTYTEPMSGYYPATYGFENDNIGNLPYDWTFEIGAPCSIQVIDELDAHKNVVELYDGTTSNSARMINNFTDQIAGTVEMWFRRTDPAEATSIRIKDPFGTFPIDITSLGGMFRWNNQSVWNDIAPCNSDQWYHLRIDFNCTSQKFDVYIDEIRYLTDIPFQIGSTSLVQLTLETRWVGSTGYYTYYDAIGYSWDSNYDIGGNLNEGLLLSYKNSTNLDWQGYSLDGSVNKTILGNTTIPLPSNGLHNIQVFGTDTLGTMCQSDIRYFTVSPINVITPENKTYTGPVGGYYPATYGFENVINGQDDPDWDDVSLQKGNVVSEIDGHKKVYEVIDNSGSSAADLLEYYDLQTNGTIEFWCRFTSATAGNYYRLSGSVTLGPTLNIDSNQFLFTNSSGSYPIPGAPNPQINTWYHVRFDFRGSYSSEYSGLTSQYTYFIYINTIRYGPFTYEENDDVGTFQVHTSVAGSGFTIWWDAVGYSWDPNYNIGDNLNEGLLLSYDTNTNFNWTGYSLDGQANRTILGNKTIPMPNNGLHFIQVFGNDSRGTMYESAVQHFSVDTTSYINIITPESKTYTEPMSGYYPATYGFENDEVGTIPDEWTEVAPSGSCSISVQDQKDNHKKVVLIADADTATGGGADATAQYNFKSPKVKGTIECWVYKESGDCALVIQGNDDTTTGFIITIDTDNNGIFRYSPAPNTYVEFAAGKYSDQEWFHIRIDFDCDTDTTDIYVNGIKEVEGGSFHLPVPDISFIQIRSGYSGSSGIIYFDAVGLSWDQSYALGDNLNEGLLLSFNQSDNFEWIGYSLDGNPDITIAGNKVIPIPENGIHSVIFNGITTEGMVIQSELRYFITNIQSPPTQPENPNLIPIFLTSLGIGIVALLSITFFLLRRKKSPRTSIIMPYQIEAQVNENIDSKSDQPNFCPFCGSRIEMPSRFCAICGASLKNL